MTTTRFTVRALGKVAVITMVIGGFNNTGYAFNATDRVCTDLYKCSDMCEKGKTGYGIYVENCINRTCSRGNDAFYKCPLEGYPLLEKMRKQSK